MAAISATAITQARHAIHGKRYGSFSGKESVAVTLSPFYRPFSTEDEDERLEPPEDQQQ